MARGARPARDGARGAGSGWVFAGRPPEGGAGATGWVFARAPPPGACTGKGAGGGEARARGGVRAHLLGGPLWWEVAGVLGGPPQTALALWGDSIALGAERELGLVPWLAAGASAAATGSGGEEGTSRAAPKIPSRRRTLGVAFTCGACGERTTRLVNPRAYRLGTVFVECGGCGVKHLLVDHHNLFGEGALESPFPPGATLAGELRHPRNAAQRGALSGDAGTGPGEGRDGGPLGPPTE